VGDVHPGLQPGHAHVAGAARRGDRVGTLGADDDHPVGAAVVSGAAWPGEVGLDRRHVGAGEIADGQLVGPAQRVGVDLLHAVEVHRDGPEVAEEQHAAEVVRHVELLGAV